MSAERLHDVAIAGLGAMGSAAALELSRRGVDVIGFDRFTPPHAFGSSHGESRIIREAYFEHPVYVPMVQRAFECWGELESLSGRALLRPTGGLMIGAPDSALVSGALRSAQLHRLQHALLSADELRMRFPVLNPEPHMVGVWEPRAGVLWPEACVAAQIEQAQRLGASLRFDEPVVRWQADGLHIDLETSSGHHRARQLIVSAGAWANALLPEMQLPLSVERQVLHWFAPVRDAAAFSPETCPIHLWQFDGARFFYGFPDLGTGVKLGFHHGGEATTAECVRRDVASGEIEAVRGVLRRFVPAADGPCLSSLVCLYTNTRDEHFWIDRHPAHANVWVASPCSGHGFKFAPVIGEILADLVQHKQPRFDLRLFRSR
jgi:sarcosine oxidase